MAADVSVGAGTPDPDTEEATSPSRDPVYSCDENLEARQLEAQTLDERASILETPNLEKAASPEENSLISQEKPDEQESGIPLPPLSDDSAEEDEGNEDGEASQDEWVPTKAKEDPEVVWGGRRRRGRPRKSHHEQDEINSELSVGHRILEALMTTNSTFFHYPRAKRSMIDYHDVIKTPMWFLEIKRRFESGFYQSVADFVSDVRLLLENAYRYFGPEAVETKRALRIEGVLEDKLKKLLPKNIQDQLSIGSYKPHVKDEVPIPVDKRQGTYTQLLERVGGEREVREERNKKALEVERLILQGSSEQNSLAWEKETLLALPAITQMRCMWELPQIGQFIQLTLPVLHIKEVSQFEIERMFLMPQASKTLAVLMTSLLSPPAQRPKLHSHPPMPYSIWSRKLGQRVAMWYKYYYARNRDPVKLFELYGIEKEFWSILGDWNQLEDYEFFELSFHQRVWLFKTLCDHLVHHHKTMQDALADQKEEEKNCEILGQDRYGRQYLHFPQFCYADGSSRSFRVYRQSLEFESVELPHPDNDLESKTEFKARSERKHFLPVWMRRGRGRGRKSNNLKRRNSAEINNRNFLSRLTYRMPNALRQRKRGSIRSNNASLVSTDSKQDPASPTSASVLMTDAMESLDCQESNKSANSSSVDKRITRGSTFNKPFKGFYTDWSDSDDSTHLESVSQTKGTATKRAFAAVSMETNGESLLMKSDTQVKTNVDDDNSNSNFSNTLKSKRTLSPEEDNDSTRDSGCDDSASSVWTTATPNVQYKDDEQEQNAKDDDGILDQKKENEIEDLAEEHLWLSSTGKEKKNKTKREKYDPKNLLLGAEHFELAADSVQGLRELVENLFEDDSEMPLSEKSLEQKLKKLISEYEPIEYKLVVNDRVLRNKLYQEWTEFQHRSVDFVDETESYWLRILQPGTETIATHHIDTAPIKTNEENVEEEDDEKDESEKDGEPTNDIRHSLRLKTRKIEVDNLSSWHCGDSESSSDDNDDDSDDQDDWWEQSGRRRKKKSSTGRGKRKRFTINCGEDEKEDSSTVKQRKTKPGEAEQSKAKAIKHSRLTLDKHKNMFITLGGGHKILLKQDGDGKIIVPEGHDGLAAISGKTLQQLILTGKIIPKKSGQTSSKAKRRSTTLFPAAPLPMPPSDIDTMLNGDVPEVKKISSSVSITVAPSQTSVKTAVRQYINRKKETDNVEMLVKSRYKPILPAPKPTTSEEIVCLSDESDDSIELITTTHPGPRIESVVGNANIETLGTKPLTKSVTMTPVTPNFGNGQWTPTIVKTQSLDVPSSPSVSRVRPPGAPEVVITPASGPPARRNLQQVAYQQPTPNQNFMSVTTVPVRQSQQQFVPVNQFVRGVNDFVPANNQIVNMNNQYVVSNGTYVRANGQFLTVSSASAPTTYVQVNNSYVPAPLPAQQPVVRTTGHLPISSQDMGLPAGLSGQIVVTAGDNGQFMYALKLDDGGIIFLTTQQLNKIRAANGGNLTNITLQIH